jgi:transposase-like protein
MREKMILLINLIYSLNNFKNLTSSFLVPSLCQFKNYYKIYHDSPLGKKSILIVNSIIKRSIKSFVTVNSIELTVKIYTGGTFVNGLGFLFILAVLNYVNLGACVGTLTKIWIFDWQSFFEAIICIVPTARERDYRADWEETMGCHNHINDELQRQNSFNSTLKIFNKVGDRKRAIARIEEIMEATDHQKTPFVKPLINGKKWRHSDQFKNAIVDRYIISVQKAAGKKVSITQLAKRSGVDRATFVRWINAKVPAAKGQYIKDDGTVVNEQPPERVRKVRKRKVTQEHENFLLSLLEKSPELSVR